MYRGQQERSDATGRDLAQGGSLGQRIRSANSGYDFASCEEGVVKKCAVEYLVVSLRTVGAALK